MKRTVLLILVASSLVMGERRLNAQTITNPKFATPPPLVDTTKDTASQKPPPKPRACKPPTSGLWSLPELTLRPLPPKEQPIVFAFDKPVLAFADTTVFGTGNFRFHQDMFWLAVKTSPRVHAGIFLSHEYEGNDQPVTGGIGLRFALK